MSDHHWTETAERTWNDRFLLGESDRGEWWCPPSRRALRHNPETPWARRFRWWKPWHWPYWVRSRVLRRLAYLDRAAT